LSLDCHCGQSEAIPFCQFWACLAAVETRSDELCNSRRLKPWSYLLWPLSYGPGPWAYGPCPTDYDHGPMDRGAEFCYNTGYAGAEAGVPWPGRLDKSANQQMGKGAQ